MKSTEFCYWLQGFFELSPGGDHGLSPHQAELIKKHLNLVFIHEIDPSYPADQQDALNKVHNGPAPSWDSVPKMRC